jgi:two-component system, cell cycle response regulator
MDRVIDQRHADRPNSVGASSAAPDDVDRVVRETRQQFVGGFAAQCERIAAAAESGTGAGQAIESLHRMAGLAGTIGFPRVSTKAAELENALRGSLLKRDARSASLLNEDALGESPISGTELRDGVAALRQAFSRDVVEPVAQPASPGPGSASMTVLLVEDEPFQRALICAQLRKAGHLPVEVSTGEEVLPAARQTSPDIILLDVGLPGIDGYAVCRMLKADAALADIPVAFLSANSHIDDRLAGLSFGADDFLTKPIDPRELALRLERLKKRAAPTEDRGARGVLSYEAFAVEAARELRRERCSLALIRTPADRVPDVAACTRDEIRRRDLIGQYDRSHVVVLLPDTGAAAARERIAAIVETCRVNGIAGVHAGVAASAASSGRTLDQLLEEADEALAIARYEGLTAALRPATPRGDVQAETVSPLVIVGDDDPDVVRIVDAHLASGGYRRVLTFDGVRALEEVRAQRPDVLLLDLMMPRMTGFDVLAGLREMGDSRPRVIVLSARGREDDVIRAFSLGADDFVAKPFNPQELLARIARLVK